MRSWLGPSALPTALACFGTLFGLELPSSLMRARENLVTSCELGLALGLGAFPRQLPPARLGKCEPSQATPDEARSEDPGDGLADLATVKGEQGNPTTKRKARQYEKRPLESMHILVAAALRKRVGRVSEKVRGMTRRRGETQTTPTHRHCFECASAQFAVLQL